MGDPTQPGEDQITTIIIEPPPPPPPSPGPGVAAAAAPASAENPEIKAFMQEVNTTLGKYKGELKCRLQPPAPHAGGGPQLHTIFVEGPPANASEADIAKYNKTFEEFRDKMSALLGKYRKDLKTRLRKIEYVKKGG